MSWLSSFSPPVNFRISRSGARRLRPVLRTPFWSIITRIAFGFVSPDVLIALAMLSLGGHKPVLPDRNQPTEESGGPSLAVTLAPQTRYCTRVFPIVGCGRALRRGRFGGAGEWCLAVRCAPAPIQRLRRYRMQNVVTQLHPVLRFAELSTRCDDIGRLDPVAPTLWLDPCCGGASSLRPWLRTLKTVQQEWSFISMKQIQPNMPVCCVTLVICSTSWRMGAQSSWLCTGRDWLRR